MIKKTLILLLTLLPLCAKAQQGAGSWKVFTTFEKVDDIIETPDMVYYISSGSLYGYDKSNDESVSFTIDNFLTDTKVSKIYYNPVQKYLAVVYESANIDLLYDSGKIVNIPDIRDASLTFSKKINDITFSNDGQMIVSANFGVVVYDDQKHQVAQSGIYNEEVSCSAVTDGYIFIFFKKEPSSLYYTSRANRINNKAGLTKISSWYNILNIYPLEDDMLLTVTSASNKNNRLRKTVIDFDTNKFTFKQADQQFITKVSPVKDGYMAYGNNDMIKVDTKGEWSGVSYPAAVKGQMVSSWNSLDQLWAGDAQGIANYDIKDGNLTVLMDKYMPDALTLQKIGRIYCSPSGKTFVHERGLTNYYANDWSVSPIAKLNKIENGSVSDEVPDNLTIFYPNTTTKTTRSIYDIVEDPTDPSAYYMASYNGIAKIKDGKEVAVYNYTNSTLAKVLVNSNMEIRVSDIDFDRNNNLWTILQCADSDEGLLHCLPAEKLKQSETDKSDWKTFKYAGRVGETDGIIVACKKSDMVLATYRYAFAIMACDMKNNKTSVIESVIDQDGKEISLTLNFGAMVEDKKGQVWVGTSNGVFVITNPAEATNPVVRVNHVKVPRNDGTNFADYLLEGEYILAIDVDASNRKWIATQNSGVYLVSEDGSKIIEHFTTANSKLNDNKVYAVGCDRASNAVYFGTTSGLIQYNSDSAPAENDYSDVYAYPNPVRPEYSGWITIRGLMDNSLVKIADAAGNVFFEGMSEGGMLSWDGCGKNGERVKTGVYYVFASQSGDTGSTGAVTKILVVK